MDWASGFNKGSPNSREKQGRASDTRKGSAHRRMFFKNKSITHFPKYCYGPPNLELLESLDSPWTLPDSSPMLVPPSLGLIVGTERELRHHEARLRTNAPEADAAVPYSAQEARSGLRAGVARRGAATVADERRVVGGWRPDHLLRFDWHAVPRRRPCGADEGAVDQPVSRGRRKSAGRSSPCRSCFQFLPGECSAFRNRSHKSLLNEDGLFRSQTVGTDASADETEVADRRSCVGPATFV